VKSLRAHLRAVISFCGVYADVPGDEYPDILPEEEDYTRALSLAH